MLATVRGSQSWVRLTLRDPAPQRSEEDRHVGTEECLCMQATSTSGTRSLDFFLPRTRNELPVRPGISQSAIASHVAENVNVAPALGGELVSVSDLGGLHCANRRS